MKVSLPYGNDRLSVEIPESNLVGVLRKGEAEPLDDVYEAVLRSLRSPIGKPPLGELLDQEDEIAIIVDDHTRPCPDDRLLPPLLEGIEESGVKRGDVKIVVAYGLHSPLESDGLVELLGEEIVGDFEIVNHVPDETVNLGVSSRGVPIEVNKEVMDADFRISTGLIEPHFFAGFSGGRKSIMPGVSSRRAIYGNHGYEMIADPHSRPGELEENPIYLDSIEHAERAGLDFILNVTLTEDGQAADVVGGDPIAAHLEGAEAERERALRKIDHEADIVVTTNSGAPLDLDFYQTVKGIYHASLATKKDGIIVVASECADGIGPREFRELHGRGSSPEEVTEIISRKEPIGVQWENQLLAEVQKNYDIYLKSSVDGESLEDFMVNPIDTVEEGLEKGFEKLGEGAEVVVIPSGPMVIPRVTDFINPDSK